MAQAAQDSLPDSGLPDGPDDHQNGPRRRRFICWLPWLLFAAAMLLSAVLIAMLFSKGSDRQQADERAGQLQRLYGDAKTAADACSAERTSLQGRVGNLENLLQLCMSKLSPPPTSASAPAQAPATAKPKAAAKQKNGGAGGQKTGEKKNDRSAAGTAGKAPPPVATIPSKRCAVLVIEGSRKVGYFVLGTTRGALSFTYEVNDKTGALRQSEAPLAESATCKEKKGAFEGSPNWQQVAKKFGFSANCRVTAAH